jgi:glucose-1-phosphate cytidylyltransferase
MTAYRVRSSRNTSTTTSLSSSPTATASGNIDINASIAKFHKKSGQICTMTAVHPPGRFGELGLDDGGRVHRLQ